ncbi:MAG TPA: exodeoxyribonuclease VII large subunit [Candidatus Saccharimonadales bacterium]|nr:exodeoxyribonuclease VII large subunit [Candidatus Saccharimonadales bacterium]
MNSAPSFAGIELAVSDFVALVNQTFEYAYRTVTIRGELANFKVSKNRWVYFDLKDDGAMVRFFGTVYQLPGPLEDGMMVVVRGAPRLHPRFGFSVSVSAIRPSGEGTIRRSAEMLQAALTKEGLFDVSRKRALLYPPTRIGLITSVESAAYADFIKILDARWHGVAVECIDVQVQGENAPAQIVSAVEAFNRSAEPPDALVLIRGGGSADDLYAFSTESVTRAVAASRVPTLVAIGHEIDISLAELAADQRASTPSNAAELLVPDRKAVQRELQTALAHMHESVIHAVASAQKDLVVCAAQLARGLDDCISRSEVDVAAARQLLMALDPRAIMQRGYAIVRMPGVGAVRRTGDVPAGAIVDIEVSDGHITARAE